MNGKNRQMAEKIAEATAAAGGRAYYAGGFVRDHALGRPCKDLDLEIHGLALPQLEQLLDTLGQRLEMGKSFGIFALRHYDLDIAVPRDEAGQPAPQIGTKAAARRRDLTVNAMMQDVLTGQILDHFGGMEDLQNKVIRHVDESTFSQDPLRVLRAARFASQLGFSVAQATAELAAGQDLSFLAPERVLGETEKALMTQTPSVFFRQLRQMGQLQVWFAELQALIGVEQEPRYHPEGDVWEHTMLVLDQAAALRERAEKPLWFMLSALCHDFGKPQTTQVIDGRIRALGHEEAGAAAAGSFLGRLTRETKRKAYVCNMVQLHMRPNQMWAQRAGDNAMCRLYDKAICPEDLLLLCEADHRGRPNAFDYGQTRAFLLQKLALYRERMQTPCVTGEDLLQAGFRPGPQFHDGLQYAHKLHLAGVEKENALKQTVAYLNKIR